MSAKKQKTAPEKAVPVKKQPPPKKVESSSSDEDSSDSEVEVPVKKQPPPKKVESSSSEEDSEVEVLSCSSLLAHVYPLVKIISYMLELRRLLCFTMSQSHN